MDFFRPFYSDLCLEIDILPTMVLDYVIAVYPLLLMIITYLLIVLYDRKYRVITIMWRPFQFLFSLLKSNWDIRTSLIDSFATFFLLSYGKFLSVDLLVPTKVYYLHGNHSNHTLGLFYAADIIYFGNTHLHYGILAIAVLCVFVILPTVVFALYPFSFFQKFLNLFPFRWYVLHTFMDSFYGCYKDGTQPATRDYRWFASIFFVVRISQFLLYFSIIINFQYFFALVAVTGNLHAVLVVTFQPFKSHYYNKIHIVFLQVINIFVFLIIMGNYSSLITPYTTQGLDIFFLSGFILAAIPPLYVAVSICHWMWTHRKFGSSIIHRFQRWRQGYDLLAETLPDRMENSDKYHRGNLASFVSQPAAVESVAP